MRRLGAMILSTCLITTSILIVPIKESSSTGLTFSLYSIDQDFNLISIDPLTGSSKVVGPIGYCVEDMSFGPDGLLYASADLTTLQLHGGADTLITINITTGEATIIGPIGFNDVDAIAFAPNGTLYGADYYNGTLIEINPSTGQASEIGLLKYPPPSPPDKLFIGGMDFSPNGTLYGTEVFNAYGPSTLVTIDVGNGTLTAIGPLGVDTVEGIAFAYNGTLYGVSAVGFGNCNGDLLTINPKTGEGTIVGSVGVDQIDGLAAFPSTAYPPTGIPVPDAGEDQIVNEGDVVQFNGSASSELLNVLHVSAWGYNELQMMIESTGYSDNVSVTQVRLSEFNTGNPNELSVFDAIVFGFGNGYEKNREPIGRTTELRDFVSKGGGIVWTHDTLELTWDYGSDLEEPAGVNFDANYTHYIGLNNPEVEIIMDHDIIHYPFDIGNVSDLISKTPYPPPWYHYDHTSQSNVTTADIVIQHNTTPESKNFYLTIHEYGRGRVALQEIGHTVVSEGGSFLGIPSIRECKILVNAIYWVGEGERISNMLSYSWDFDATADSDGDGNPTNDIDATGQTPTHVYGDDGVYTVTLKVTDDHGLSNTDTMVVTVNNLAPTILPFGPIITEEGSPLFLETSTSDPGSDDLTFTWNWNDGTIETQKIYFNDGLKPDLYPSPMGTFPFYINSTDQHTFMESGIYTIYLTVEDDDGGLTEFSTNVTVISISPPTLYINVSHDGKDIILCWKPKSTLGIDHYLIYRATSQIEFDFNSIWVDTSKDNETGELGPIPLRTIWNDTNAALSNNDNYEEQYYYVIRMVNILGSVSRTSRTVGKWTKCFPKGVSTFSLPLEPIVPFYTDYYIFRMNASYVKYMDPLEHTWKQHNRGDGNTNNTLMRLGEGYEVKFERQTYYTFTGKPGAMISYDDDSGFSGFDHLIEAKSLNPIVDFDGNVILVWDNPVSMSDGWYEVYYSNTRDGFFGELNTTYFMVDSPLDYGINSAFHNGACADDPGARLYYMVVPFNGSGIRGASTYSKGIWTEEYWEGYDTIGIPLKLNYNQCSDWYCDRITYSMGINYYNVIYQEWWWHSTVMPEEAFDPILEITEGYQISTSNPTHFPYIGI